jgi:threonine/homoserine/homoserine lactone efflux protein
MASATAFSLLKFAGSAYLLYLAWGAFCAGTTVVDSENEDTLSLRHYYLRGIIMNVTNPKVSIFFLAFLPQFADPTRGSLAVQIVLLGISFIVSAILVFGLISFLAGTIGEKLQSSSRTQILLNRIAGVVFAGLAIKLATAQR